MPSRVLNRGVIISEDSMADHPFATFESLTQAGIITVIGVAIIISNILIIAAFINFRGELNC